MDDVLRHALIEAIGTKVHEVVNELTRGLSPEDDEDVRDHLNETFRFWREG